MGCISFKIPCTSTRRGSKCDHGILKFSDPQEITFLFVTVDKEVTLTFSFLVFIKRKIICYQQHFMNSIISSVRIPSSVKDNLRIATGSIALSKKTYRVTCESATDIVCLGHEYSCENHASPRLQLVRIQSFPFP